MFKLVKEIRSKEGVLHFKRYEIFKTPWFICYLHKIYEGDKDLHLHNHPWNFFGIILAGHYVEEKESGLVNKKFMSMGYGDSSYFHKIKEVIKPTTSLFFVSIKNHEWGYKTENGFVNHETYRQQKNQIKS